MSAQLVLLQGGDEPRSLAEIVERGRRLAPPAALIPRARRSDPQTSHDAARSVGAGLEPLIVATLVQHGPQTKDEIARRIPDAYAPSVTTAISRLRKAGMVEDSGQRKKSDRNRDVTVWRLAGEDE